MYQRATGMMINIEKSVLAHNEFPEDLLNETKEALPFPIATLSEGVKYLGFSLNPNCYSFQDWIWLYRKIETRVSLWTNIFIFRGSRLVLLKAILQSIPVYWVSIAYIPKGILKK